MMTMMAMAMFMMMTMDDGTEDSDQVNDGKAHDVAYEHMLLAGWLGWWELAYASR